MKDLSEVAVLKKAKHPNIRAEFTTLKQADGIGQSLSYNPRKEESTWLKQR